MLSCNGTALGLFLDFSYSLVNLPELTLHRLYRFIRALALMLKVFKVFLTIRIVLEERGEKGRQLGHGII